MTKSGNFLALPADVESQFKRRNDAVADALELLRNSKDSEVRLYRRGISKGDDEWR
jgi:hypothetical protein